MKQHALKAYWEAELHLPAFLTALDGDGQLYASAAVSPDKKLTVSN
jgi:hypothetical protein